MACLPPQYGIYCFLVGGFFHALLDSSRQLAIGPTSAISMLVGLSVADMAGGIWSSRSANWGAAEIECAATGTHGDAMAKDSIRAP